MRHQLFVRAASTLALLSIGTVSAAPAVQQCVSGPEAEALVITAVPALITTLRLVCATKLPANSLLLQSNSQFLAKYQAESDSAWPLAKQGLGKVGGADLKPLLESQLARPALAGMVGPLFSAQFKPQDCAPTDRLVTMLAPLPPRNAAAALVAFLQMAGERRKKDPAKQDLLPICGYGQ
jgi:hypothetical protein